jgi:glycosyltransferase involved in cell wall biosynthesis
MTVSVIIRTYNRAHSIGRAIRSVLRQTYQDFEIIVVDDGSTDATTEVVRSFRDERIRLFRHETNRGVGAACNTGIACASGRFVCWLDSDDFWLDDKLQHQVEFLCKYRQVDAVFSDVCIQERDRFVPSLIDHMDAFQKNLQGRSRGAEFIVGQREMYLCLLQEVPIKPTALMVRRTVFDKVGLFDESARSGEDWEFLLRLAHHSSFGYIDRPLAEMYRSPDSTFDRFRLDDKAFLVEVFTRERLQVARDPEASNAVRAGLRHHFISLGYCYVEAGKFFKAAATYLRGFHATNDAKMILQAGAAFLPITFRKELLRRAKTALSARNPRLSARLFDH